MPMPLELSWQDIAIRLALSVLAGALIGVNRERRRQPAGLRTTTLVALAASVAMIQANLLLPQIGKAPDSFVVLDLMRLPLGILSGIGFIGAGAIMKKGDTVRGVTTAATIWFVTVIGLCFGGGQLSLGAAAVGLALLVLWGFKWIEHHSSRDCRAILTLTAEAGSISGEDLSATLAAEGFHVAACSTEWSNRRSNRRWTFELHWRARRDTHDAPPLAKRLSAHPGVIALQWKR
jgi:putative Mg2+ transporter-C (MgtC) family protein